MKKIVYNEELNVGDSVICVKMEDPFAIPMGMKGIVKSAQEVMGDMQYGVKWGDGSTLALIDGVDKWIRVDEVNESKIIVKTKKDFMNELFNNKTSIYRKNK